MNICCVYTVEEFATKEKPIISPTYIPFGISYIATVLKENKFNVNLLVLSVGSNIEAMLNDYIKRHKPRLFCLTAVSSQFPFVCSVARKVKELDPSIYIVLGGHHATLFPDSAIDVSCIDCICIGEGEDAIVKLSGKLMKNEAIANINNLWIKGNFPEGIQKNKTNPFLPDLDTLPAIDRSMWEPWINNVGTSVSILAGRGCPNKCTYCSNHILARTAKGKYVRFRSPENIISEIENIIDENSKIDTIYLELETLCANMKYAYNLLGKLKNFNKNRQKQIKFGCNIALNPNVIDNEELLMRLKQANFYFVNIGLESGSERIRRRILKRPSYLNDDLIRFCRLVRRYEMKISLFAMIGIPGETVSDFRETIQCIRKCVPDNVGLSIYYPYPGTKLYNMAREMNLVTSDLVNVSLERKKARLDLPGFSKKQIQLNYILFEYYVFKGIWPLPKIIVYIGRRYLSSVYILDRAYQRIVGSRLFKDIFLTLIRKLMPTFV